MKKSVIKRRKRVVVPIGNPGPLSNGLGGQPQQSPLQQHPHHHHHHHHHHHNQQHEVRQDEDIEMDDDGAEQQIQAQLRQDTVLQTRDGQGRYVPPPVDFTNYRTGNTHGGISHSPSPQQISASAGSPIPPSPGTNPRKRSFSATAETEPATQQQQPGGVAGHHSINSILNTPGGAGEFVPIEPSLLNQGATANMTPAERKTMLLDRKRLLERETEKLRNMMADCERELAMVDTDDTR